MKLKKITMMLVVSMTLLGAFPKIATAQWVYQYTVEPYSFYRNTVTGKTKMVQTTPTMTHLVNTMVGGWVGRGNFYSGPTYNYGYRR